MRVKWTFQNFLIFFSLFLNFFSLYSLSLSPRSALSLLDAPIRRPLTWLGFDPTFPSLPLNSHLDSVPAEPSKWAHPPFSAHRTPEGHIFTRGAQDDKCIAI
ncbi:putative N-acyl-aliphatic-L-amino acid amidohydrolase [Rosa chinensis]|uniref:Putative N-acyl-aliphatic-L-amino acid amidohydrolase n=1 Tax=Rosa chinensis TaxID=74649 RepID=A0A2P6SBT2_ROSCH|nr:putative N-acyl-aliphatic-L-amino acid amidohydrolase [Rosa chinensis]